MKHTLHQRLLIAIGPLMGLVLLISLIICRDQPTPSPAGAATSSAPTGVPSVAFGATVTITPTETAPSPPPVCAATCQQTVCVDAVRVPPEGTVFPNQLIITGTKAKVDQVIADINAQSPSSILTPPLSLIVSGNVQIGLYEISGDPFDTAVSFNTAAGADQLGSFALAEPNYVLSQPKGLELVKWAPGVQGSPGSSGVEGSPGSTATVDPQLTLNEGFVQQRAFTMIGGAGPGYLGQPTAQPSAPRIIVLDASSWDTGNYFNNHLCVYDILQAPGIHLIDRHGPFVSSLASAVSEDSSVHLIQVLKGYNEENIRGDLFTLLGVLVGLIENDPPVPFLASGDTWPAHTVINLSLGFEVNPALPEYQDLLNSIRGFNFARVGELNITGTDLLADMEIMGDEFSELQLTGSGDQVWSVDLPTVSLGTLLLGLEQMGYVVVAAAGNNALEMPQSPASYRRVIGVEALNGGGERACFSNRGDVSAPGGGMGNDVAPGDNNPFTKESLTPCDLPVFSCKAEGTCLQLALTGHMPDGQGSPLSLQLGYWAGTSFAAPLVSGLAAKIIDVAQTEGTPLTPAQVRSAVYCVASINSGSIEKLDPNPHSWKDSAGLISTDSQLINDCIALAQTLP